MKNLVVIGAGRKAEHLCDLFNLWPRLIQLYEKPYTEHEEKHGTPVVDYFIRDASRPYTAYSAIGDTRIKRARITQFIQEAEQRNLQYSWGRLIHRTCIVTNPKHIGMDFTIRELSSLGTQIKIGDHVSIGPLANISHNSTINNYSTICGQVGMSGGVSVGEGVFVGQGASIKPGVTIGDGAIIGTGAVVVKDVVANTVVAGNPANTNEKFMMVKPW